MKGRSGVIRPMSGEELIRRLDYSQKLNRSGSKGHVTGDADPFKISLNFNKNGNCFAILRCSTSNFPFWAENVQTWVAALPLFL